MTPAQRQHRQQQARARELAAIARLQADQPLTERQQIAALSPLSAAMQAISGGTATEDDFQTVAAQIMWASEFALRRLSDEPVLPLVGGYEALAALLQRHQRGQGPTKKLLRPLGAAVSVIAQMLAIVSQREHFSAVTDGLAGNLAGGWLRDFSRRWVQMKMMESAA